MMSAYDQDDTEVEISEHHWLLWWWYDW